MASTLTRQKPAAQVTPNVSFKTKMKLFNVIRSYLIMLKAASLQGRSDFEAVIALSKKALAYHPKSEVALAMLADDLIRLECLGEAKKILSKAVKYHPKSSHFNLTYAQLLQKTGSPLEEFYPYVQAYLNNRPNLAAKQPVFMRAIAKILGKADRFESTMDSVDIEMWANDKWAAHYANEFQKTDRN